MATTTMTEAEKTIHLAIGRLLRLGSRPAQPGDVAEYERIRDLALRASAAIGDAS